MTGSASSPSCLTSEPSCSGWVRRSLTGGGSLSRAGSSSAGRVTGSERSPSVASTDCPPGAAGTVPGGGRGSRGCTSSVHGGGGSSGLTGSPALTVGVEPGPDSDQTSSHLSPHTGATCQTFSIKIKLRKLLQKTKYNF